jgi:hypothetical protein
VKQSENALKQALSVTPECLSVERMSETLSEGERRHVEGCSRCHTELQLWREFELAESSPEEGAAVHWIAAELGRRARVGADRSAASVWRFGWLTPTVRRFATAAAALTLVTTIGFLAWDREPAVRERTSAPETYRTGQLHVVGPVGDQSTAPREIQWAATAGAVGYDIEVFEVDHTLLWRATATDPRVELPATLVRQLVPGKTVLWEVRARNAANHIVAESGTQRFRVELPK